MSEYEVLPRAAEDLFLAVQYTRDRWGDAQVDRLQNQFDRVIESLSEFPEIGRSRSDLLPGLRSMPVFRFHLLYVVENGVIVVVRFVHQKRNLTTLMFEE
ncbi:MAG TPA: type II toxin-antitoxin system RelE/ParE family toxin [Thermomicrobiales bacterium]|nr:type II toxin-antitoxin system RelE/ParE family toxin [Thermomicrobiales bacterium]